jgi:hypothetical protein
MRSEKDRLWRQANNALSLSRSEPGFFPASGATVQLHEDCYNGARGEYFMSAETIENSVLAY